MTSLTLRTFSALAFTTTLGMSLGLSLSACSPARSTEDTATEARTTSAPRHERITGPGVAAVVDDHLGDRVTGYGKFTSTANKASVVATIHDGGATQAGLMGITVTGPGSPEGLGRQDCKARERRSAADGGTVDCEVLPDGTLVSTSMVPEGFSDTNANGVTLTGLLVSPDGVKVTLLFESWDPTPSISQEELRSLISDPRLTWRTDPAVNDAGRSLKSTSD
jgi:hypothetical protein